MSRPISLLIAFIPLLVLVVVALTPGGESAGLWLLGQMLEWQRTLQRGLSLNMMAFSQHTDPGTLLTLVGLSLGYGVFHAVGPGHGKAVISTYLLVHRAELIRGIRLTVAAAFLQGIVAIALVGVLVIGLGMLTRHAMAETVIMERVSYALVALLGGWLSLRALMRLRRLLKPPVALTTPMPIQPLTPVAPQASSGALLERHPVESGGHHHGPNCHCGQDHHVHPGQVGHDWRESLGVVFSIGMRPCSGAIMILGVAVMLGHWWIGVAAVLAMSLGTALTTSALAAFTVLARRQAGRLARRTPSQWQALLGQGLALCGGLVIAVLGMALLMNATAPAAPIL
ncbi:nickel/cobalt transporter [Marinobacter halodurans]|uniref:Nickel/cobalt efflux system n=1 Tax=Marinobacter halodurans TaxID=2528979 RepID=A0ABY1ZLZ6_9GAMM|nr:nickel/cobalt transporter [Marinobacter halodurans]TBW53319.1 nickel/cobalt transporter [Marinobacter halodurans]